MKVNNWEEVANITFEQAQENSVEASVVFCSSKFIGFYVELEPHYGMSLLVYDSATKRQVLQELGIHYTHYEDVKDKEVQAAKRKLFDIEVCCNTLPCTYWEYRKRIDFVVNIYSKRYENISGWYIGKPTDDQKYAAEKWHFCPATCSYFSSKDAAKEIVERACAVRQKHKEKMQDMQYLQQAFIDEFYNYECMYSARYDEAVAAVGLNIDTLTETQRNAYHTALRKFYKQINERGEE